MDVIVTCATCVTLASASPRNPKVVILVRSSYLDILLVVKRSQRIGKSSICRRRIEQAVYQFPKGSQQSNL